MHFNVNTIRRTTLATAILLGGAFAPSSFAAEATANTSGTVVTPITITKGTDLNFGEFAADPTTAGTVTVSTGGAATATTAVVTGGTASAATFTVAGSNGATYGIGIASTVLTHTDTATTMALTTTHDLDGATAGSPATGTLDATTGNQTIYVGGQLSVAAAQKAGVYSGTITATVNYN